MKLAYISGKITGLSEFEYTMHFARAEERLRAKGYGVINPIKLPRDLTYEQYMKLDIMDLLNCDVIYMLDGWSVSPGARLEYFLARAIGLEIEFEVLDNVGEQYDKDTKDAQELRQDQ